MCLDRVHRFMMAFVIGIGTYLVATGITEGLFVLYFVIGMLVIFGATNFCPSVWMMQKIGLKKCD